MGTCGTEHGLALTHFASIHVCNFAIPTKEYMLQCLDTKGLRNTTECRDDNAINRINRVKLVERMT